MPSTVTDGSLTAFRLLTSLKKILALALLPLACGAFALSQLRHQQPHWGGQMSDPSYIYLLSSLNLATFAAPGHVDHPGTPVQVIGALTLRALHPTVNSDALAFAVLSDPEPHARAISQVLIVLTIAASLGGGVWVFVRTQRMDAALFSQISAVLVPNVMAGYSGIRPEPLLIACAHLWIAAMLVWAEGRLDLARRNTWMTLAVFAGLAVSCKYTFAPLLIVPLVLLRSWRARILFLATAVGAFFVCVSPALPQFRRLASWVFRLAVRDGIYGHGDVGFGPQGGWTRALTATIEANWLFVTLLALSAGLLAFGWRDRRSDGVPARYRQLGIATTLALAAALVMVAKQAHGSGRYLLPAAACLPLGLYAGWRCHCDRLTARLRHAVLAFFGLAVAAHASIAAVALDTNARAGNAAAVGAHDWIARNLPQDAAIPYFGASSVPFALAQADAYAKRWAAMLARIYPGFVCYELWGGKFRRAFSDTPEPPPGGAFYLTGALLTGGVLEDARRSIPWTLTLVWTNGVEAVYRATPRAAPPSP